MIEWWARSLNEEMFGHWSKRWRQALLEKYKYKDTDPPYFQVPEAAHLHEHEDGLMAHGEVARRVFETLLQDGLTWFRPGWNPEYCCLTNADYVAMFQRWDLSTLQSARTFLAMSCASTVSSSPLPRRFPTRERVKKRGTIQLENYAF